MMDERADLPRISIDTVQEWNSMKSNYVNAAVASLDARLKAKGLNSTESRERCLAHINEVNNNHKCYAAPDSLLIVYGQRI